MEDDNFGVRKMSILFYLKTENTVGNYNLRNPNQFNELIQYVKCVNQTKNIFLGAVRELKLNPWFLSVSERSKSESALFMWSFSTTPTYD